MHTTSSNRTGQRTTPRSFCRAHRARPSVPHPSAGSAGHRPSPFHRAQRTRVLLGGLTSWALLSAGTILAWTTLFG